jgi:hypothetical protein
MRNAHMARSVLELLGKEVYVDAQKDSIRVKFLQESGLFDVRVIHLVRDVRGGSHSFMKHNALQDAAWAARAWKTQNMNADRARRYVAPGRWMRLRYDDVCADPQGTFDRIAGFVGVESAPLPANFYDAEHHIIGNSMRLGGHGAVRLDESWKSKLSSEDLDIIARVAGSANRYFGHDWPQ